MVWAGVCQRIGHAAVGALALASAAAVARGSDLPAIQHQPVRCLVAGKYPELAACFEPSSRVARARLYFRGEGTGDWYYVEMRADEPCHRGVLPRPKKSLKTVSYYVAVTDVEFAEARTEEYTTQVVADQGSCPDGMAAPFLTSASVVVGGASALPAGFVGGGILAGVGTTAVVAGAAVVGAGAAGAAIAAGGGEEPASTTPPPVPPTTVPTTTTTTTTTVPGCPTDSAPPEVRILSPGDNADVGARIVRPRGCGACHGTGYRGRTGIFEVLEIDDELRDLVKHKASILEFRQAMRIRRVVSLRRAGFLQVEAGVTTVDEVMRVTT